jgi:hypothetical protein
MNKRVYGWKKAAHVSDGVEFAETNSVQSDFDDKANNKAD